MRQIPLILVSFIAFAAIVEPQQTEGQLLNRPIAVGLNWDTQCAIEAATQYAVCRANGGRNWSCLVTSGLTYWGCSGSDFETRFVRGNRTRAALIGWRAIRRGR